jgi:hypothetical protein
MGDDVETPPRSKTPDDSVGPGDVYLSPVIERLGTLAELTRGGTLGPDDVLGGAGDEGSV